MSGALRPLLISALFALVFVCGCSARAPDRPVAYELCARTGVFRTDAGLLRICAPITPDVTRAVREALTDADRVILVTSGGGNQTDALELAQIVRDHDLTVRVQQFCMSSCSTYLMILAPRVEVAPYTVVAFHHTAAWLVDALAAREGMPPDARFRQASADERAAFTAAGLDDQILDRIALRSSPFAYVKPRESEGRSQMSCHDTPGTFLIGSPRNRSTATAFQATGPMIRTSRSEFSERQSGSPESM
jgi:hypothetical protein